MGVQTSRVPSKQKRLPRQHKAESASAAEAHPECRRRRNGAIAADGIDEQSVDGHPTAIADDVG